MPFPHRAKKATPPPLAFFVASKRKGIVAMPASSDASTGSKTISGTIGGTGCMSFCGVAAVFGKTVTMRQISAASPYKHFLSLSMGGPGRVGAGPGRGARGAAGRLARGSVAEVVKEGTAESVGAREVLHRLYAPRAALIADLHHRPHQLKRGRLRLHALSGHRRKANPAAGGRRAAEFFLVLMKMERQWLRSYEERIRAALGSDGEFALR